MWDTGRERRRLEKAVQVELKIAVQGLKPRGRAGQRKAELGGTRGQGGGMGLGLAVTE